MPVRVVRVGCSPFALLRPGVTRYYASTPYYMVVSDKESRELLLEGVDTFSIKRAARQKNHALLARLLKRWKMAIKLQKQLRHQNKLHSQVVGVRKPG